MTGLLDPWFAPRPPVIAALPEAQTRQEPQPQEIAEEAVPLPDDPAVTDKEDRLLVPTFDLLRVEPDGAILVAGKAEPGAVVDVLDGETVVASATAGAEGDFVAIPDDMLAPGDYQLSLRSVSGDVIALSQETAVVSIPETPDGQVLALVDVPGAASELISVPEARETAAPEPEPAVQEEEQQVAEAQPVVEEEAVEEPTQQTAEAQPVVEEETAGEPSPQLAETEAQTPQPVEEESVAAADEPAEAGPQETAAQPEPVKEPASEPEAVAQVEEETATEPEPQPVAEAEPDQDIPAETEIAALPEPEPEATPQPAIDYRVVVEAVEIEGDTIFVAGHAAAGHSVRVYANEILLGDARVSEGGRFLVEARRDLPVGDYLVRADLLAADGSVVARAAVPFAREPGETIAAVAPQQPAPAPQEPEQEAVVAEAEETVAEPQTEVEETVAAAEPEATAPALQRVDGSVIIRRGDNLWRISRRVYGQGIRYSTIYLANQDQIRNPDLIWPGQVFTVPRETPQGEQADLEAIADQLFDPEAQPTAQ